MSCSREGRVVCIQQPSLWEVTQLLWEKSFPYEADECKLVFLSFRFFSSLQGRAKLPVVSTPVTLRPLEHADGASDPALMLSIKFFSLHCFTESLAE
jgi:hypothetical protein